MARDSRNDGLDALRKHRQRRRTNATASTSNSSFSNYSSSRTIPKLDCDGGFAIDPSFRTEASTYAVPTTITEDECSIVSQSFPNGFASGMIIATSLDREKMRKISILGLDHPADNANRHKDSKRSDSCLINPSDEFVSVSESEDLMDSSADDIAFDVDRPTTSRTRKSSKYGNSTSFAGVRLSELREISRGLVSSSRDVAYGNSGEKTRGNPGSTPETDPRTSQVKNRDAPGGRFASIPVSLAGQNGADGVRNHVERFRKGALVEATVEKQQLMRMISLLGMQDPVFGDSDDVWESDDEQVVDEDKESDDRPWDRSDRRNRSECGSSLDVDRPTPTANYEARSPSRSSLPRRETYPIDQGWEPRPGSFVQKLSLKSKHGRKSPIATLPPVPLHQSSRGMSDRKRMSASQARNSPRSSYQTGTNTWSTSPTRSGRKNCPRIHHVGPPPTLVSVSPPISVGRKSADSPLPRCEKSIEDPMDSSGRFSLPDFTPPNGSFKFRKANQRSSTPTQEVLLRDMELAQQVQSIYLDDDLMRGSAYVMEQSISALSASLRFTPDDASADDVSL